MSTDITETPAPGQRIRRGDFLKRTGIAGAGIAAAGAGLGGATALAGGRKHGHGHGHGRKETTLRDRINKVAYIVVNVSDLDRAKTFWESATGLTAVTRTQSPVQAFRGLGIAQGQFDGWLMQDASGRGTQVHLLQWLSPTPIGQAHPTFWNVGLAKIALTTPSTRTKLAQLKALGIRPTNDNIYRGYTSITDPDGVVISLPGNPNTELPAGTDPRPSERLLHTNPSVKDIRRSMRFYGEILGLDLDSESVPCEPILSSQGPGSDLSQWDSHLYTPRGDTRFRVDLSQFHYPPPTRESVIPYKEANHVGISRLAFEVDDIDACYEILRRSRQIGKGPGPISRPEEWDFGAPTGKRRVLTFRDPDGIRLELIEKVYWTPVTACTQPVNPPPIPVDW